MITVKCLSLLILRNRHYDYHGNGTTTNYLSLIFKTYFKQVFLLSITGRVYEGLDDPLHAYITGATAEDVQSAVKKITDLVNLHVYNPESEQVCKTFK